ncbi:MAG: class I SAM-dependent methyltransferase, partial [Pygmaiobacter sp.]
DGFNVEADYEALHSFIRSMFQSHGLIGGIIADLGCGTGELTLRLASDGYDMIAVDGSADMLAVLNDKRYKKEQQGILLLQQDLTKLDLYGTIQGAVSTFDTFNHIGPFAKVDEAIRRVGLFMEKGGLFLFDVNTPYKHTEILHNNTFTLEDEDAQCVWKNTLEDGGARTKIELEITDDTETFFECFYEYSYALDELKASCERHGFEILDILDGETFHALSATSQRALLIGEKIVQCQS